MRNVVRKNSEISRDKFLPDVLYFIFSHIVPVNTVLPYPLKIKFDELLMFLINRTEGFVYRVNAIYILARIIYTDYNADSGLGQPKYISNYGIEAAGIIPVESGLVMKFLAAVKGNLKAARKSGQKLYDFLIQQRSIRCEMYVQCLIQVLAQRMCVRYDFPCNVIEEKQRFSSEKSKFKRFNGRFMQNRVYIQ